MFKNAKSCASTEELFFAFRYPLELHMIHIEDEYVSTIQKGKIDFEQAFNNSQQTGVAILSVLFKIDHRKPQVLVLLINIF